MEDGSPSPSTMFGSLSESILDFDCMDELFCDGYWLETTEDRSFPTLGVSDSDQFNLNPQSYQEGMERADIDENPLLDLPQPDNLVRNETSNREVILAKSYSGQSEYLRIFEGTETNKRLWAAPNANPNPYSSLESRLMLAIEQLRGSAKDSNVLIQIWVPIKREGKKILVTKDQLFLFNPSSKSLASYRDFSKQYHFAAEENSNCLAGLPGRVFLKRLPEWTPDVRFFKVEEYPRVNYAQQCNVSGSLALPVFEPESGTCLGVVEIVSTTPIISYRPELESICKALQAVDLRSSEISSPPIVKECDNSYETTLVEIREVLKSVCDTYGLPLAQTWAPCVRPGKCGCSYTEGTRFPCISTVNSACYIRDEQVFGFHEAC